MAPIRRVVHMTGQTLFAVFYSLFFTGVILLVTVLMFDLDLSTANLFGGLVVLISGSLSFVGISIMVSSLPLLFPERGAQMTHIVIAVLLLVSGVYYPIEVLPIALQKLGVVSPATYILNGVRQALLEGAETIELWPNIWPVILIGIALIPAGLWVFGLAERYAKRTGKLARNG
jgi:ABC-2 type transport system permease protein